MRLLLLHPEMTSRSCEDCKKFIYNDSPQGMAAKPSERAGKPILRIVGSPTPCFYCPKIPEDAQPRPENAVELSPKNWAAYFHFLECEATGSFPEDPIVRYNAAMIHNIVKNCERLLTRRDHLTAFTKAFRKYSS